MHPPKRLFVEVKLSRIGRFSLVHTEAARRRALGLFHLLQEIRTDGQEVAAGEMDDLVYLAKTRSHDLRLVIEFLEVIVNPRNGRDAGILVGGNVFDPPLLAIPIVNAADER